MGNVFALLSAVPGKEQELLAKLAEFPGVVQQQWLFGEQIAVRLEEAALAEAQRLASLTGVREARVYHDHDAVILPRKPRAPTQAPAPAA
jgi:hypothetical protein